MEIGARHSETSAFTVVLYGSDLAGFIAAATLSHTLPDDYRIIHIIPSPISHCSALYGGITGTVGYDLFRAAGIEEPDLILATSTSFSYGTSFTNWPSKSGAWVQCYSQPFIGIEDAPLDQIASAYDRNLQDYLVSAQAALAGRFAHPPDDPKNPLSRAEYGYHFIADEIAKLAQSKTRPERVETVYGQLEDVCISDRVIEQLTLSDGKIVKGDMFIDVSGIARDLMTPLANKFVPDRSLKMSVQAAQTAQTGPPCRSIIGSTHGWRAVIPLRKRAMALTIADAGDPAPDTQASDLNFQTGRADEAWQANCVSLGNAMCTMEPLSSAPITLLHRALQRLCELMPIDTDMAIERREFNRQTNEDLINATAFHRAHYSNADAPDTPFWKSATSTPLGERLERKITQFESRGLLVQYDLEPFNSEDWAILHHGIGRRPRRHDIRINTIPRAEAFMDDVSQAIAALVKRMPPHDQYLTRFSAYLEKKQYDRTASR
jgi:tryptophan halogenase